MTRGEQIAADIRRATFDELRSTGKPLDAFYLPRADFDEFLDHVFMMLYGTAPNNYKTDEIIYNGVLVQPTTETGKTLKGLWWDTDKMRDLRNYWKSKGMQT